ncbi:ATP-binding protein [Lederbergia lenta]|uniref:histidine kinase n=1 Tax=Lederbergia lenta TaxID=1467 RepID=A0A2X4ZKU2_LEDLE|nr:ATP-binding protein [Lederbergia lenta]MCM3110540.1 ATP-binding protein [Lederbergia lenta]MEC2323894.1 ATP-binding protein [Lederbergia lenta]SQI61074.1 sensor histidine kinase [Lederbergia lenta]
MLDHLTGDVLSFLMEQKGIILSRWKEKIIIPAEADHTLHTSFEQYGEIIFTLVEIAYTHSDQERDWFIKDFANTTAQSKIKQHSNIESFIYNINIAKTEIFYELSDHPTNMRNFQPHIYLLFRVIDLYLHHIMTYFSSTNTKEMEVNNHSSYNVHEDRLYLLGQMTASFVHEFRNPLTVVNGFIQLLHAENPKLPYIELILNELDQLKFQITQFLLLSKNEIAEIDISIFTLNELLEQIATFIYPRLLEVNVELESDLEKNLYIRGKVEEVRQVIINIIFNAIEVVSEQASGSVIYIKGYQEDDNVILALSNTGPKIPESVIQNIFEPFMTTKKKGTGLGLYISKQIIEKHGGRILCQSDSNLTTFKIILPSIKNPENNCLRSN